MKRRDGESGRCLSLGSKVAPAVGLLLFGEGVLASDDGEPGVLPEPSVLALLAAGAAGAGVVRGVQALKKRRKKK